MPFGNLKARVASHKKHVTRAKKALIAPVATMLRTAQAVARLQSGAVRQMSTAGDYRDLKLLARVIKQHGMSRGLMEFVNPKNRLATMVPGLPATERLNATPLAPTTALSRRARSSIANVCAVEGQILEEWLKTSAEQVKVILDGLKEENAWMDSSLKNLKTEVGSASISEETLAQATTTAIPAVSRTASLSVLSEAIASIDAPEFDPEKPEDEELAEKFFEETVDKIAASTGAVYADHVVTVDAGTIAEEFVPRTASLSELGYISAESVTQQIDHAREVVAARVALVEKSEAILGRVDAVADDAHELETTPAEEPETEVEAPATESEESPETENENVVKEDEETHSPAENTEAIMAGWYTLLSILTTASSAAISEVIAVANAVKPDVEVEEVMENEPAPESDVANVDQTEQAV